MADQEPLPVEQDEIEEQPPERSYIGIVVVVGIVIIIVIIVLASRGCAPVEVRRENDNRTIESVEDLEPGEQSVSIWVREDADLYAVLRRNGLEDAPLVALGDGTYVVAVEGDAADVVERLRDDPGLYDAGLVYQEEE